MSSLADYFNRSQVSRHIVPETLIDLSEPFLPTYTLYRDGEPVLNSSYIADLEREMSVQLRYLQSSYLPPEHLLSTEYLPGGIQLMVRNGNSLTARDSTLAEFVIRQDKP